MTRQRALWVGEEMSSGSDLCSLFMGVSKGGWTRGKERERDEKRND